MEKIKRFVVSEQQVNIRLDKFLADNMQDYSRMQLKSLIEENLVLVNENITKASYKTKENDIITVKEKEFNEVIVEPQKIDLNIIYEDDDILVVDKEKGMVVHPGHGNNDQTLVNALLYKYEDLSNVNGETRRGIVHRLDKDTSGLILIAKNDESHNFLASQFKDKTAGRVYLAIVHGVVKEEKGIINVPLSRDPKNRIKKTPLIDGKEAITHFKVLERFKRYTLVECSLETGRTHQIRVHMSYIGHPVAGDSLYGARNTLPGKGQFLHAKKLVVIHPSTKQNMTFESKIPTYFQEALDKLRDTK